MLFRSGSRESFQSSTPEGREDRIRREGREFRPEENRKNQKELAQIFFAGIENKNRFQKGKKLDSKTEEKPARRKLGKKQCAFCKEIGHWKDKCPKKNLKEGPKNPKNETPSPDSNILYVGEDSD